MEHRPLISILCLCYNQAEFIIESLDSIKAQTYKHFEILICDDFSTKDNSTEVIENWINENPELAVTFIKHTENKGICKTLNELLKIAKGKYIQILALDDILLTDKLERHLEMLEKSEEKNALVFSDAHLIDNKSNLYQNKFIALNTLYLSMTSQNYYNLLVKRNFIPAMSVLMKKDIIISEGGWDEDLSYEDYDMWLCLSKKYDFLFDETISCCYRLHENNAHKKTNLLNDSYFKILFKHRENNVIKGILFRHIRTLYLERRLKNEHRIYYSYYPTESLPQKCIKNNWNPIVYYFLTGIEKILGK